MPRCCTMDGFVKELARLGGMDTTELDPLTELVVRTRDTSYVITVIDPFRSEFLFRTIGSVEPAVTVILSGSSFGGSLLKQHWIGIGMRMELYTKRGSFVTAPVVSATVKEETHSSRLC